MSAHPPDLRQRVTRSAAKRRYNLQADAKLEPEFQTVRVNRNSLGVGFLRLNCGVSAAQWELREQKRHRRVKLPANLSFQIACFRFFTINRSAAFAADQAAGAGRRNRTDILSLEGCCTTIVLYPPAAAPLIWAIGRANKLELQIFEGHAAPALLAALLAAAWAGLAYNLLPLIETRPE